MTNDEQAKAAILNTVWQRYAAINVAASFEDRPLSELVTDSDGNRARHKFNLVSGAFTAPFGNWFTENILAPIFGNDATACLGVEAAQNSKNSRFMFALYGDLQELKTRAENWETQGIQPSEDNPEHLLKLMKDMAISAEYALTKNPDACDSYMGGLFSNNYVVHFTPPVDIDTGQKYSSFFRRAFNLRGSQIAIYYDDKGVHQVIFTDIDPLHCLRWASRNGHKLVSACVFDKPPHLDPN